MNDYPPPYISNPKSDYWKGWQMAVTICRALLAANGHARAEKLLAECDAEKVRPIRLQKYAGYRRANFKLIQGGKSVCPEFKNVP